MNLQEMMPPQEEQQQPAPRTPSTAQTVAALHRLIAVRAILAPIAQDPKLGTESVRPKLLNAASKLLAEKIMTLPEIMETIKALPEDPTDQKQFVDRIYEQVGNARAALLEHHYAAPPTEDEEPWSPENHDKNISQLMEHYRGR
jgi:hypothetical protein